MKNTRIRTYSELIRLSTFEERFRYLQLFGEVGKDTFGFDRFLNQDFYRGSEWRKLRNKIIVRDYGCDLAMPDRDIGGKIIIHHMNPIEASDILDATEYLMNPEFLICTSLRTHNAIHYGNEDQIFKGLVERQPNDTCPWKRR